VSWVRVDDDMPDSPKIVPLSDAAFRAYVTSICYSSRNLTDGFIPGKKAREFVGKTKVLLELVGTLWEITDGGFNIHDYLIYNPTRAEVEGLKDVRSKAGAKGAARRWQTDGKNYSKPMASAIANEWQRL